ncbi:MAG: hypothetical protein AAGA91_17845 [Pseudomonadota bacterium]
MDELARELQSILAKQVPLNDADLSRATVLRHRIGRTQLTPGRHSLPSAPAVDVFEGVRGVPEVNAAELTGAHVACGLRLHGALVVRGLVDPVGVDQLRGLIDGMDWSEHRYASDADGIQLPDAPPMRCTPITLQGLIEVYLRAGMREVMTEYMGEAPVLLAERTLVDRRPLSHGLPWHQDAAFFGGGVGAVNSFLALDECGRKAPGLMVISHRFNELRGVGDGERSKLKYGLGLSKQEIIKEAGGPEQVSEPHLQAGDAIFLDEMTFHRTGRTSKENTNARSWAVTWFFPPSRFPEDRHPLWFG